MTYLARFIQRIQLIIYCSKSEWLIIGGEDENKDPMDKTELYNLTTGFNFKDLAAMPTARYLL